MWQPCTACDTSTMDAQKSSSKFRLSQRQKRRLANQTWNELMKNVNQNQRTNRHINIGKKPSNLDVSNSGFDNCSDNVVPPEAFNFLENQEHDFHDNATSDQFDDNSAGAQRGDCEESDHCGVSECADQCSDNDEDEYQMTPVDLLEQLKVRKQDMSNNDPNSYVPAFRELLAGWAVSCGLQSPAWAWIRKPTGPTIGTRYWTALPNRMLARDQGDRTHWLKWWAGLGSP